MSRLENAAGTKYYLEKLRISPPTQFLDPETTPLLRITDVHYTVPLLNILKYGKEADKRSFPGHDLQSVTLSGDSGRLDHAIPKDLEHRFMYSGFRSHFYKSINKLGQSVTESIYCIFGMGWSMTSEFPGSPTIRKI